MRPDAEVGHVVGSHNRAHERRLGNAAVELGRDPAPRVGHERVRRDLAKTRSIGTKGQLGTLVEPAVDVLEEAVGLVGRLGWEVARVPRAVKPEVEANEPQVKEVVEVLAAGNPRVEGRARVGFGMDGQAAAAGVVGTADARTREGAAHPGVELGPLGPPAFPELCLALVGDVRAGLVDKVAGLGKQAQVLAGELAQAPDGLDEELARERDLVVVHEDHDVMPEQRRGHEAHVADGSIAAKRDGLAVHARAHLVDAAGDETRLRRTDDKRVERRVVTHDGVDAGARRGLGGGRRHEQDNGANHAANVIKRVEAAGKLWEGLVHRSGMIIRPHLHWVLRPIRRYDNRGIHGCSLFA